VHLADPSVWTFYLFLPQKIWPYFAREGSEWQCGLWRRGGEAGLRGVLIQTHMCTVSRTSPAQWRHTIRCRMRSGPERLPIKFLSMLETFSENLPSLRPDLSYFDIPMNWEKKAKPIKLNSSGFVFHRDRRKSRFNGAGRSGELRSAASGGDGNSRVQEELCGRSWTCLPMWPVRATDSGEVVLGCNSLFW